MTAIDSIGECPLSLAFLESYRLALRKRARAGQVGEHLLRRKGQSLEFEELAAYTPGDDFRHIDWRASARFGGDRDLLVRRFRAEEQLTLVVSVDNRQTMALLPEAPKIQVACWLAYAVATIAANGGDRVFLHRLFGPPGSRVAEIRGRRGAPAARRFLAELAADPQAEGKAPDLRSVAGHLPPASVWLLVTDLYFDPAAGALARAVSRAQQGLRWVILVDLDNWPQERLILGHGGRHIEGPGLTDPQLEVQLADDSLRRVERVIQTFKESFRATTRRSGLSYVHWPWPEQRQPDLGELFRHRFKSDRVLQRLFRRET